MMPTAPEKDRLSRWIEFPQVAAAEAVIVSGTNLFVVSSSQIVRIDFDERTLCALSGFPDGHKNVDLALLGTGRLVLSASEGEQAAVYWSEDNGRTWNASDAAPAADAFPLDPGSAAARAVVAGWPICSRRDSPLARLT